MKINENELDDLYCPICEHDYCICTESFKNCVKNFLFENCEYKFEDCLKKCACMKGDKLNEKTV